MKALDFANLHTTISENEIRTILHCRKSLLFFQNEAWVKKSSQDCFDVTMGSYDGAEVCELVGLLILNNLSNLVAKNDAGLYRDDGLIVVRLETSPSLFLALPGIFEARGRLVIIGTFPVSRHLLFYFWRHRKNTGV